MCQQSLEIKAFFNSIAFLNNSIVCLFVVVVFFFILNVICMSSFYCFFSLYFLILAPVFDVAQQYSVYQIKAQNIETVYLLKLTIVLNNIGQSAVWYVSQPILRCVNLFDTFLSAEENVNSGLCKKSYVHPSHSAQWVILLSQITFSCVQSDEKTSV